MLVGFIKVLGTSDGQAGRPFGDQLNTSLARPVNQLGWFNLFFSAVMQLKLSDRDVESIS